MDRPPVLSNHLVEELKQSAGLAADIPSPPPAEPDPRSRGFKPFVKRLIRRSIGWYVDPAVEHAREIAQRSLALAQSQSFTKLKEISEFADALRINLELLKSELRAFEHRLESLGMAIAPAAGLEAAGARLAELRERLNAVERRTRHASQTADARPSPTPRIEQDSIGSGFDYVGFEYRFRGAPEVVAKTLSERYLKLLRKNPPVLDVGCGRGELLELLKDEGIPAEGVDTDHEMVIEALNRGLQVLKADAVGFLRSREEGSFGSIIAIHVAEHLELNYLVEFLELSVSRLKPGGILILETPNPTALIVLGNSYLLDPTHVRPLHPSLLTFLCENAGFRDVRLEFHSPAEGHRLHLIEDPEAPGWVRSINEAFERLNRDLFGPQEYSLIATAPMEKA